MTDFINAVTKALLAMVGLMLMVGIGTLLWNLPAIVVDLTSAVVER